MEYVIPRVEDLYVLSVLHGRHSNFPRIADLMDQCASTLTSLELKAGISDDDMTENIPWRECIEHLLDISLGTDTGLKSDIRHISLLDVVSQKVPLCGENNCLLDQ